MRTPKVALENEPPFSDQTAVLNTAGTPDETSEFESEIHRTSMEQEEFFSDRQELSVVLESLSVYTDELEHFVRTKSGTTDTLALLRFGAQQQLNRIDFQLPAIGLESAELDITAQHKLVLEGVKDFIEKIKEYTKQSDQHFKDILSDTFSSTETMIAKYEAILRKAKETFEAKKPSLTEKEHGASLSELWYHFSTDKGQTTNVLEAVKHDLELSKYLLTIYPAKIIEVQDKFSSIFTGAHATGPQDIDKLAKKVESLPIPGELFDKKYIGGGKPYLSVTGLEIKTGSTRNTLSIGEQGKALPKLAVLATPRYIVESGSFKHAVKKIHQNAVVKTAGVATGTAIVAGGVAAGTVGGVPGMIAGGIAGSVAGTAATGAIVTAQGKDIIMSTIDIDALLNAGEEYIANVKQYLVLVKSFNPYIGDFYKFLDSVNGSEEWLTGDVSSVVDQMEDVDFNIWRCFTSPAKAEIARSLKGAKYCAYLAQRMTAHAK